MRAQDDLDGTQPAAVPPADDGIAIPISMSRTRIKLLAFVLLAVLSYISDSPEWLTAVLILTGAAIPLALFVLGGAEFVRELFLLPPRPVPPITIRKDDLI
ncbi:hypothetical protein GCM10009555_087830 [Acrocarpospora macrocephala]|uniref:Uncharacterized protein n=1 Tax=Acrocarpospora macrocephala TaxID=150177 RepID=A0A5M3WIJ4_9ACTN|nr:hypothetical protein [Acrocarpospora macrocephala]GES08784.1 hypothetical protein Amac_023800 [Acrocarpospora macrocephala]